MKSTPFRSAPHFALAPPSTAVATMSSAASARAGKIRIEAEVRWSRTISYASAAATSCSMLREPRSRTAKLNHAQVHNASKARGRLAEARRVRSVCKGGI